MNLLAIAPADAHALTMVAILVFALGSLVTLFVIMAKNGKRNAELDLPELPDEDKPASEQEEPPENEEKESRAEWEKDPDWWKK